MWKKMSSREKVFNEYLVATIVKNPVCRKNEV